MIDLSPFEKPKLPQNAPSPFYISFRRIIALCYLRHQRDRWTLQGNLHEMGPRGNSAGRSNEIAYRSRNNPSFTCFAHDVFCVAQ